MRAASERILVVEDDRSLAGLLVEELEDAGYTVVSVDDTESARQSLAAAPTDLVISDLRLPGEDGLGLLRALDGEGPGFIILTAFGTIEQAVEALKAGADEFLTKPVDIDHLLLTVSRVLENRRLKSEVRDFREAFRGEDFHGLLGDSAPMRELFDQIRQVAGASGPVLVVGDSGTGKELVARAVHRESDRAKGPFLAVNCAGIPTDLLESEFFGHAAGAFTGAVKAHEGIFSRADGGTLLLDEIGEMPMSLQVKLLRVLQEGVILPVGGERERKVDVRVIAATHRDLEARVGDNGFREDLFYRLETFTLKVPPLRERGSDLELLAARFIRRYAVEQDRPVRDLSPQARELMRRYPFPGNVRELQNAVERAVTFCHGARIEPEHLPTRLRNFDNGGDTAARSLRERVAENGGGDLFENLSAGPVLPTLEELERRYVRHVLERVDGNKRRAAALLGVSRQTLYRKLGPDT
jgi:DNA-binding NtrC family response regulator